MSSLRPKISLIISTYNWPEALELVFKSVLQQTVYPLEVIIADDGSGAATNAVIEDFKAKISIPVKHVWHEDKGFRKTIILNEAVKQAVGDYIVQIDGDIILHPKFIEDHLNYASIGHFIKGSRGRLMMKKTKEVLQSKSIAIHSLTKGLASTINATRCPLFSPLFYGDPKLSRKVKGCNFAFWKDDFMAVNGYNNDLEGWGHEDIEIAARLVNNGTKCKHLKMVAVCYHLYHQINSRNQENSNLNVYENTIKNNIKYCIDGFNTNQ